MAAWTPLYAAIDQNYARAWDLIPHWLNTLMRSPIRSNSAECSRPPLHQLRLLIEYVRASGQLGSVPDGSSVLDSWSASPGEKFEHAGLHGGLCEMVWTTSHILGVSGGVGQEIEGPCSAFDDMLVSRLREGPWETSLDAATGLTGQGLYLLGRWPRAIARSGIELIMDNLSRLAERGGDGCFWPLWRIPIGGDKPGRPPEIDLSLPTGMAGIVRFLSGLVALEPNNSRAANLLEGAIEWLMRQQNCGPSLSRYGDANGPGGTCSFTWADADLGILVALSGAGCRDLYEHWNLASTELREHCLNFPSDFSEMRGLGLASGAFGVGHIFDRLFHSARDPRLQSAARSWFDWAIDKAFEAIELEKGDGVLSANNDLFDGTIGCCLSLLAAVDSTEPAWDEIMFLSGPKGITLQ